MASRKEVDRGCGEGINPLATGTRFTLGGCQAGYFAENFNTTLWW